jgi:hypothetical protein
MNTQKVVIDLIIAERQMQDEKFGEQLHTPPEWVMIIGEEFGEVAKAALENHFNGKPLYDYRMELVQLAAVCVNALESYYKNQRVTK